PDVWHRHARELRCCRRIHRVLPRPALLPGALGCLCRWRSISLMPRADVARQQHRALGAGDFLPRVVLAGAEVFVPLRIPDAPLDGLGLTSAHWLSSSTMSATARRTRTTASRLLDPPTS